MSARSSYRAWSVMLGIVLATTVSNLQARDWADSLATPLVDPLRTRPERWGASDGSVYRSDALATEPCPVEATAYADQMQALTLAQALDVALCRNPQLRNAWAVIKEQAAALGEANAAYLPTLTLSTSRLRDRMSYPNSALPSTSVYNRTVYGNLSWRLFDFGGRSANRHVAEALLDAALANRDAVWQKTLTAVIGGYFDAQTAWAVWQARQKNEELAHLTLQAAQRRQAGGAGSQSDTLQASTAWARAKLDKSRAQGNYQKSMSILVYALGLPTASHLTLAQDQEEPQDMTDNLQQALADWIDQAQAQHPALIAARAQLLAAKEKVSATESEGLPTLDFMANRYQNGRPNQGLTSTSSKENLIGLTLSIPLFDGFARTYKVRGAQAQVEQKAADLQDTEHQVLMEIVKAHADVVAALENLDASANLLHAAQAALASVQRKFDKGAADMLEMLSIQAALSDAQQERIRCLAEWRSARLRLLAAAGQG